MPRAFLLALLLVAALRWHAAAADHPIRVVRGAPPPRVVLVTQSEDCPVRTAALRAWASRLPADPRGARPLAAFASLRGPAPKEGLEGLARLDPAAAARAGRALARAGVAATPGILFLDAAGHPVGAIMVGEEGPDPTAMEALGLLHASPDGGPAPLQTRTRAQEEAAWNP